MTAIAEATVGSVFNVQAIEQGRADVAFMQVDVAYFAYSRGTDSSPRPHMRRGRPSSPTPARPTHHVAPESYVRCGGAVVGRNRWCPFQ